MDMIKYSEKTPTFLLPLKHGYDKIFRENSNIFYYHWSMDMIKYSEKTPTFLLPLKHGYDKIFRENSNIFTTIEAWIW